MKLTSDQHGDRHRQLAREPRHAPISFIMVEDPETHKAIGKVLNLNEAGMCLMVDAGHVSSEPRDYLLMIYHDNSLSQYITVTAELIWKKPSPEVGHVIAGFHIEAPMYKSRFRLKEYVKQLESHSL